MSLGSATAKGMDLLACYGSSHSIVWPSVVYLTLWAGSPTAAGVELTVGTGNYARVPVDNDDGSFLLSGTSIQNAIDISFDPASDYYSAPFDYWAFMSASTGGVVLDFGPVVDTDLTTPLTITVNPGDQVVFAAGSLVISA